MSSGEREQLALSWQLRLLIRLGVVVIRLLGKSWRIRIVNQPLARQSAATHSLSMPAIFLLWHGQMLPILYAHNQRTGILISEHKDGELIARIAERFGNFGVRGSTSRGGARALLEAARVIRSGTPVAITPDGPRGPRHSFAPGALILAHRTGAPLITITAHASRVWRLKSWDGFEIPKPFSRITVHYSDPRLIEEADVRIAAERSEEFRTLMLGDLERTQEEARRR